MKCGHGPSVCSANNAFVEGSFGDIRVFLGKACGLSGTVNKCGPGQGGRIRTCLNVNMKCSFNAGPFARTSFGRIIPNFALNFGCSCVFGRHVTTVTSLKFCNFASGCGRVSCSLPLSYQLGTRVKVHICIGQGNTEG